MGSEEEDERSARRSAHTPRAGVGRWREERFTRMDSVWCGGDASLRGRVTRR